MAPLKIPCSGPAPSWPHWSGIVGKLLGLLAKLNRCQLLLAGLSELLGKLTGANGGMAPVNSMLWKNNYKINSASSTVASSASRPTAMPGLPRVPGNRFQLCAGEAGLVLYQIGPTPGPTPAVRTQLAGPSTLESLMEYGCRNRDYTLWTYSHCNEAPLQLSGYQCNAEHVHGGHFGACPHDIST